MARARNFILLGDTCIPSSRWDSIDSETVLPLTVRLSVRPCVHHCKFWCFGLPYYFHIIISSILLNDNKPCAMKKLRRSINIAQIYHKTEKVIVMFKQIFLVFALCAMIAVSSFRSMPSASRNVVRSYKSTTVSMGIFDGK